ncbi:hypothetical protein FU976_07990 [Campylobacter jejuni]|nr:hypothetical protein [Campylobacter jejuni]
MDIISLGKASKALRLTTDLDVNVVAAKAEDRFLSVDARLDWIEQQASNIMAKNSYEVDLSKKTFNDVQIKDGSLQLKELSPGAYVGSGTWESDIVDLGDGWQQTLEVKVETTT